MFNVLQATLEHLHQLVDLRMAVLKELNEVVDDEVETVKDATTAYLSRALIDQSYVSFVVEIDGEIVSTSGLIFFHRLPNAKNLSGYEAYLLNVYTLPQYRNRGFANRLVEICVQECKSRGVKRIFLNASEQGKPMYVQYGFTSKDNVMELFI